MTSASQTAVMQIVAAWMDERIKQMTRSGLSEREAAQTLNARLRRLGVLDLITALINVENEGERASFTGAFVPRLDS